MSQCLKQEQTSAWTIPAISHLPFSTEVHQAKIHIEDSGNLKHTKHASSSIQLHNKYLVCKKNTESKQRLSIVHAILCDKMTGMAQWIKLDIIGI